MTIITKTALQKNIGKIKSGSYIVVNGGKPESIILPYFEGNEEWIENYLEEYEIMKNSKNLQREMKKSLASGKSNLVI